MGSLGLKSRTAQVGHTDLWTFSIMRRRNRFFINSDGGRDYGRPTSCAIMVVAPPRPDICYPHIYTLDASSGCASDPGPDATDTDAQAMEDGQ